MDRLLRPGLTQEQQTTKWKALHHGTKGQQPCPAGENGKYPSLEISLVIGGFPGVGVGFFSNLNILCDGINKNKPQSQDCLQSSWAAGRASVRLGSKSPTVTLRQSLLVLLGL